MARRWHSNVTGERDPAGVHQGVTLDPITP
jgi:hypothetical protein